jgi:O-antigen ligase
MILPNAIVFGFLFPALVLWGGSTNLINWGPGLLICGAACLLLLDKDRYQLSGGELHTGCFLALLALMLIRSRYSADVSYAANSTALIGFAAGGFLIGRLANDNKSRALSIGLAVITLLNFLCSVVQMKNPGWNPIYPERSADFPCGFFAHYSYSAAFCLGSAGLLISGGLRERAWLRAFLMVAAASAVATVPISLSRGGNLALAFMMAAAVSLVLSRAFSKSKSVLSTWFPAIILLALVLIFASSIVPMIGRNKGLGGFYADSARIDFWHAATQISSKHPWLGGGPGSFSWEIFHVMGGLTLEPTMVHNETLQMAVEYGYPALVFMAALIVAPVVSCCWRFINKTDASCTAWAAIGLVAMLIQSNFESIFHSAPGAFVAALILGQVSRGLWGLKEIPALAHDQENPEVRFLNTVKARVDDYLAGNEEALPTLMGFLRQSKDHSWRRNAYDLVYWKKTDNDQALRQAMIQLGVKAIEELEKRLGPRTRHAGNLASPSKPLAWRALCILTLATCALPILISGTRLSNSLIKAWVPLYHPRQIAISDRFEQLLRVVENRPGLGMDRIVLSAARECIYQYDEQEDRENWATSHRSRILRSIPGWRTDPGSALLAAEIIGWAGDYQSALEFYNHAIAGQGANESLFMAHSFKGQYLYELSLTSGLAGNLPRQRFFARQAIECFKNAAAALGEHQRKLDPYFSKILSECETFGKNDM